MSFTCWMRFAVFITVLPAISWSSWITIVAKFLNHRYCLFSYPNFELSFIWSWVRKSDSLNSVTFSTATVCRVITRQPMTRSRPQWRQLLMVKWMECWDTLMSKSSRRTSPLPTSAASSTQEPASHWMSTSSSLWHGQYWECSLLFLKRKLFFNEARLGYIKSTVYVGSFRCHLNLLMWRWTAVNYWIICNCFILNNKQYMRAHIHVVI